MPCVTQLYVNENILKSVKSESAPCIKERVDSESLNRVVFKTNPKPLHVNVNMKHIACPLIRLFSLV